MSTKSHMVIIKREYKIPLLTMKDIIAYQSDFQISFFNSYPTKFLSNLSQTLPVVPLPIKGSNTNSTSVKFNRSYLIDEVSCN